MLLCSLLFALSCDKTADYEYAVVCDFPEFYATKNLLLVTAEDGTVLKEIQVPSGRGSVSEKFTLHQKEPHESFNLHVVQTYPEWTNVFSYYGARNGESIHLHPRADLPTYTHIIFTRRNLKIRVNGLSSSEYVAFPGCNYHQIEGTGGNLYEVSLMQGQGIVVELGSSGSVDSRWLYLPNETLQDSMSIEYAQFLAPEKHLILQAPPLFHPKDGVTPYYDARVYVVSPDDAHSVMLGEIFGLPLSQRRFWLPPNLPSSWEVKVLLSGEGYSCEKTFPLEAPIQPSDPILSIDSKSSVPGESLHVRCSGPVEWMDAVWEVYSVQQGQLIWNIMGPPHVFENLRLPQAVKDLLPGTLRSEAFKTYTVRAFRCPEFGYDGMARGFPWKSSEPFAATRQGYEVVKK